MSIVTLASVHGAPGVTTTALLLASMLPDAVSLEADLEGGVLAVRYGLGREPGLTTLAAAGQSGASAWRAHAQSAGGVPVLVGPDSPTSTAALWRSAGERITQGLRDADATVVVDAGRLRDPVAIVAASDLVVMLVHPVAEQVVALGHALPTVRNGVRGRVAAALVGDGPYKAADVEETLSITVLAEIAEDRAAAEMMRNGGSKSRLVRSRLARSVTGLGEQIGRALCEPTEAAVL
jgi:MinD-like ATPase involved in chromosome partitioning or flagellar assembly